MKRIVCLVMSFVVILSFTSCISVKNEISADSGLTEKIIADLGEILSIKGKMYSGNVWAMEYVQSFCENPDLLQQELALVAFARLCDASEELIGETENAFSLTAEDYSAARNAELDISFIENVISGISEDVLYEKEYRESFRNAIMMDSFWEPGTEYLQLASELRIEEAELEFTYYRLMTNYILLQLGFEEFPEELIGKSHGIIDKDTEFIKKTSRIERETDEYTDSYEKHIAEYAEMESLQQANLAVFSEAAATGDMSELYSYALEWGRNYTPVPLPSWENLEIISAYKYVLPGGDGVINIGDDLTKRVVTYSVRINGISWDAYRSYIAFLESAGGTSAVEFEGTLASEGKVRCAVRLGGDVILSSWENNCFLLSFEPTFSYLCQDWYLFSLVA